MGPSSLFRIVSHIGRDRGNAYGYEPGQNSQVEGGNADREYNGEVDADEVDGHMQDQTEEEDTDVD